MPTKIEDIYDALITNVSGALPDYVRLPNPYDITTSNFLSRTKGYAIEVGPAVRTDTQINCSVSWERVFIVTIANKITTTENNTTLRAGVDKALMADHRSLLEAFYNDLQLSGLAVDADISDDSGIEIVGEEQKFLGMSISILVKYEEDLRT